MERLSLDAPFSVKAKIAEFATTTTLPYPPFYAKIKKNKKKAGFALNIVKTNVLTEEQTRQIRDLEARCIAADGLRTRLFLSTELNYDRSIPVFFLAEEGGALIGFLTFFIPTREEAEISAVVLPDARRRGVFTALNAAARQVIADNGIGRILYCVQAGLACADAVLRRRGLSEIQRSEYRMLLKTASAPAVPKEGESLRVVRVTAENAADYTRVSSEVYGDDSDNYLDAVTNSTDRFGFILYADDRPVGIFSIGTEEETAFIYGVAVAGAERGRGYGKCLTALACRAAAKYGDTVQLDVDSVNPRALHIYRAAGFETAFRIDYFLG